VALDELRGTELGTQTITIEAGPVRAFAQAVGDDPARYRDGSGASIGTPPTWPFVMPYWSDLGEGGAAGFPMDRLRGPGRMILHGEQGFEFQRSPRVGETLVGEGRIADVYEKQTGSATMEFYVREITWRDEAGDVVVVDRFTMIVRVPTS
jgi:hypothetical protein